MKSNIAQGQMILFFNPLAMDKPSVWVKTNWTGEDEPSMFINNDALVQHCINGREPSPNEKWLMSDKFYNEMVESGKFIPISDLNEAKAICEEKGYPKYEINLGF